MNKEDLWLETLQAFQDYGPMAARDAYEYVKSSDDRTQVMSLVGKFNRRNGYLEQINASKNVKLYAITDAGVAKLEELKAGTKPATIAKSEKKLLKKVAELEPVEPWEFNPEVDDVVRSLAALRFSPDIPLYREGRERSGRLRYLAERLERVSTTESLNVAVDLRETADMLDHLTEVVK